MDTLDVASAVATALFIALFIIIAKNARTAPGSFMFALSMGAALLTVMASELTDATRVSWNVITISMGMIGTTMITGLILTSRSTKATIYNDYGSGIHAIYRAGDAYDQADRKIRVLNDRRKTMPFLKRLRDAFITTNDEEELAAAISVKRSAQTHLEAVVPAWHRVRTEELIDQKSVRATINEIEKRLEPLEKAEKSAHDAHRSAADAIVALDIAIDALEDAQGYEAVDLVTSNKGFAAASTLANSDAQNKMERAKEALERLSQKTNEMVKRDLIKPDDTLDLIFDFASGDMFDFMSLLTISQLEDACKQCREERARIVPIERQLDELYEKALGKAQKVRDDLVFTRQPYREKAMREMPYIAWSFVHPIHDGQ